ncbi:hypothetical protein ACIBKX_13570 [Streptomyces sp. NPDC050658]|uniref:hypothetical protein n=1 Tax=unclassified Streptomyces TaxID=2593676 RepID=UPI003444E49A
MTTMPDTPTGFAAASAAGSISSPPAGAPRDLTVPRGEVSLFAPTDWLDLLADGQDDEAAQERIEQLVARAYAHRDQETRAAVTETFGAARRLFLDDGMITCGLITLPATAEDGPVTWQICAGVIDVSPLDPDINAGEVLSRHFGRRLEGKQVYVESFPTEMGTGFGLVSQPGVHPSGEVDTFPELPPPGGAPVSSRYMAQSGMAAALSCPVGGGSGLLVVGTCLDPEQVVSLAALVALICGKSTVRRYDSEGGTAGEGRVTAAEGKGSVR